MDETHTPGLSLLLTQLGKRIFRHSDEGLMGISTRHFVALGLLRSYGSVSQQALAEVLCTDANNLVILLNELEADGLAVRRRDPGDRRRHIVEITPAGRKAVARAERAQAAQEDEVLSALSVAERAQLRQLLVRAVGGAEEVAPDAPEAPVLSAQAAP